MPTKESRALVYVEPRGNFWPVRDGTASGESASSLSYGL